MQGPIDVIPVYYNDVRLVERFCDACGHTVWLMPAVDPCDHLGWWWLEDFEFGGFFCDLRCVAAFCALSPTA